MKIEAGKTYKTRDGRKATVLKTGLRKAYPVIAVIELDGSDRVEEYTERGEFDCGPHPSPLDLVDEWCDPLVLYAVINMYGDWFSTTGDKASAQELCDAEVPGGKVVKLVEVQE